VKHENKTFYFCSEACKKAFVIEPVADPHEAAVVK